MNFQEAFWFTRHQQYHQNPQPINLDPTTRNTPRSMNSHSLSFSLQDDVDNDRFPDHDDQQSTTTTAIHSNTRAQDYSYIVDREPMFEKPLTPSDVGKLNRLVIPKQHAEKYFPLNGSSGGGDGESSGEKGLVLSFDDESGKSWRFRYSYWNSSQSYVLTKGWSRFVKEKKLDAGDVVLFERHRLELDKFFIGWRRRGVGAGGAGARTAIAANSAVMVQGDAVTAAPPCRSSGGWGAAVNMYYNAPPNHLQLQGTYPPLTHCIPVSTYQSQQAAAAGGGGGGDYLHLRTGTTGVENEKAPAAAAAACGSKKISKRRLRLFGVNLECHQEEDVDCFAEPQASDASSLSSGGGGGGGGATRGGSASASTSANTTNYPTAAASSYYNNNNYNNSYYDYVGYPS